MAVAVNAGDSSNSFQTYGTLGDPFLTIYSNSFNPASPCTNYVGANDDNGINNDSVIFFVPLPAGTYIAVVSGYSDEDLGSYQLSYTSFPEPEGEVGIPVPSLGKRGLLILSLLLAGSVFWVMRRKLGEM